MSAQAVHKRQSAFLKKLAARTGGRHDAKVPLSQIAPTLDMTVFANGVVDGVQRHVYRFVDKDSPRYDGGNDLSYDLNTLLEAGLIQPTHLKYGQDASGGPTASDPAITITPAGFDAIAEANKWWIQKAIDKEPITFLQIIITIMVGIGGWAVGRYITPVQSNEAAAITPAPSDPLPPAIKSK